MAGHQPYSNLANLVVVTPHELLIPKILVHTQTCEINSESELPAKPDVALSNGPGADGPRAPICLN